MDTVEKKPPACFEPSASREQIFAKDKPSPLRIIKRSHNRSRYDMRYPKGSCAAAGFDDSPPGSPPGALNRSVDGTLRIPRRRPKLISEEKHKNGKATVLDRPSQRSSLGHSSVNNDENDDAPGQDNLRQTSSIFRYPAVHFKKFRRKRHSVKSASLDNGDGDGNLSTCILPKRRSVCLDYSSRASSRCTSYEPDGTYCSMDSSLLSNPSLLEKSSLVLSPYIHVVSEKAGIFAGQQHLWAAVEVSGRLFPAGDEPGIEPGMTMCSDQDTCSRFGYLDNLKVDILPMPKSSLLQITCQQQFPTTMFVGSSILLLVHAACQSRTTSSSPRQQKHTRQRSEELMEDLQLQLGDSLMAYMRICVSYSHSAFPSKLASGAAEVSSLHTKLSTMAEATIELHNSLSPWSPHPIPVKDRVLPLIKRHWGSQKASEAMQQMLAKGSELAPALAGALPEEHEQNVTGALPYQSCSPIISPRQTSIQGTQQMKVKPRPSSHPLLAKRVSHDWGIGLRGVSEGKVSRTEKPGKRLEERGKKWSTTTEVLERLTPTFTNGGGDGGGDGEDYNSNENKDKKSRETGDEGKKNASLWTWVTWF